MGKQFWRFVLPSSSGSGSPRRRRFGDVRRLPTRWCVVTFQNTFVLQHPKMYSTKYMWSQRIWIISAVSLATIYCILMVLLTCYGTWSFLNFMLPGVSSILCYLEFLPRYVAWSFFTCYVIWSFLYFMLPRASSILFYLEFLKFSVAWSFFHVMLLRVFSILC